MKALNLYAFTRVDADYAAEYMNMLAAREQREKCRTHEFLTVKKLVEVLRENDVPLEFLDGFFFSYSIRQIGKEFDLLKIEQDRVVLNIELKSEDVGIEEIEKQLRQNRYYLGFVAADIRLFTFVEATGNFYQLIGDTCFQVSPEALVDALPVFKEYMTADIEKLFEPRQFLISPFTDPTRFLKGKYFLTQQQQEIREKILEMIHTNTCQLYGITGSTGAGKTLLLYDIARTIARENQSCCVIHTGDLCEGHDFLQEHWDHVDLFPIRKLSEKSHWLENYSFIFVDEAHRMYPEEVDLLLKETEEGRRVLVFSYDNEQWLSHTERKRNIPAYLENLEGFTHWSLSKRIRTGIEIATFYRNMLDLNNTPRGGMDYSHIDVLYAKDSKEADLLTRFYKKHLNYYCPNKQEPRPITGQEYDNVLIIVNENFRYDSSGCIQDIRNPDSDLELDHLMYQNVTRTRSKLCILVVGNYELFRQIAGIKYQMLEQVRYKESMIDSSRSGKHITKLVKAVKDTAKELSAEDTLLVTDTMDIIQDQLTKTDANRKIIDNCMHFLRRIVRDNPESSSFCAAAEEFLAVY